jgi:hypothetical protein
MPLSVVQHESLKVDVTSENLASFAASGVSTHDTTIITYLN